MPSPVDKPTRILAPNSEGIAEAARILRDGGLVAFATETVYGLGADATSPEAVARIYAAKGRPAFNPLIAHVTGLEAARREPGEPYCAAMVAVAQGLRGEDRLAEDAIARLLEATPSFSLRNIRHSEMYRDPAYLERFCAVLQKAGLPD